MPNFRIRRSLYLKYLAFGLVIVFFSFIVLGLMMYFFVTNSWVAEKKRSLIENANQAAQVIEASSDYSPVHKEYTVNDLPLFYVTLSTISESIEADIFLVDTTGECKLCS